MQQSLVSWCHLVPIFLLIRWYVVSVRCYCHRGDKTKMVFASNQNVKSFHSCYQGDWMNGGLILGKKVRSQIPQGAIDLFCSPFKTQVFCCNSKAGLVTCWVHAHFVVVLLWFQVRVECANIDQRCRRNSVEPPTFSKFWPQWKSSLYESGLLTRHSSIDNFNHSDNNGGLVNLSFKRF